MYSSLDQDAINVVDLYVPICPLGPISPQLICNHSKLKCHMIRVKVKFRHFDFEYGPLNV